MSSRSKTTENRKKKKKAKTAAAAGIGKKPVMEDEDDEQDDEKTQEMKQEAKKWLESLGVADVLKSSLFSSDAPIETMKQQFRSAKPFPYLSITDFADAEFMEQLKHELMDMDYNKKSNDLYEFAQSDDLSSFSSTTHPLIAKFRTTLYSPEFRQFLSSISGIELNDTIDMSANVYSDTHTLLCHDDELAGRRIAYIVYLVPQDWSEADGGTLDLFNVDQNLQPDQIVYSHVPQWNSFIFFEVSPISYHQVREVLTPDKHRLSISGWFHGSNITRPTPYIEPSTIMHDFVAGGVIDDWVGREYRKPGVLKQVKKQFLKESSIELHNFLRKDKYDELLKEITAVTTWQQRGPANKRRYHILPETSTSTSSSSSTESKDAPATPLIDSLRHLFLSTEFSTLITEMTGVELTRGNIETRRFQSGDYTLAHDDDEEMKLCGLDVQLVIIPSRAKWTTTMGGSVHYLAEGADEELLSVFARANCLSIVYRSAGGVMRFVKYLNHYAASARYDINAVYRVVEDEDEDDEDDDDDEDEDEDMEEESQEPTPPPAKKQSKGKSK